MPSQVDSVFVPALTARGPVFNSLGALPGLSFLSGLPTPVALAAVAAGSYFAAKKMRSKIPYVVGAAIAYSLTQPAVVSPAPAPGG